MFRYTSWYAHEIINFVCKCTDRFCSDFFYSLFMYDFLHILLILFLYFQICKFQGILNWYSFRYMEMAYNVLLNCSIWWMHTIAHHNRRSFQMSHMLTNQGNVFITTPFKTNVDPCIHRSSTSQYCRCCCDELEKSSAINVFCLIWKSTTYIIDQRLYNL